MRAIGGLFDSTGSVTRAGISDVTHPSSRGPVFTWLGAVFALARIASSAIGGLFSGIRIGNDYLLPCMIGAGLLRSA